MKYTALFVLLFFALNSCVKEVDNSPVEYFNLGDVKLLDSEFKNAQELDKQYLLTLEPDRLLAPFLREAGLETKAESYPNWENTGLDGHIGGHYLTGLSLMYAATGDKEIKQRLDYMISELKRCQDANGNGYIGGVPGGQTMWDEVKSGDIRAGAFSLNEKWVPLYNIHKTYAGLRDAWLYAHSETAKQMLVDMTDWMLDVVAALSDEQIQTMLNSEYGGLNETFADVAEITGEEKYLELAKKFSHHVILDPLIEHRDDLDGKHANTQIPKVIGYQRVAELGGDASWADASLFFWEDVVSERSVCIGGNSVREHFHPRDDFSGMMNYVEGPETCNTYNMLKLTKMLYKDNGNDSRFMDYYEKALYNHILASINPDNGGLVYFTPMRPNHYRVYSQPETSFWCCVGSGIENHGKYGEMIYAHTDEALFVNLFIPSVLNWKAKETEVVMETQFPDNDKVFLTINPKEATKFELRLRYPSWVEEGALKVLVNGSETNYIVAENGYAILNRKWQKGDKVELVLPMKITLEQMEDGSNNYSFEYGPIVLAAKTGTEDMDGLYADASRMGHVAQGTMIPLKDRPVIVASVDDLPTTLAKEAGDKLVFKLNGLYPETYETGLELLPFYRVHDSRYNIYWPCATEDELSDMISAVEEAEKARIALDEITVDKVGCGEQQPESDHFIKFDDSWTGYWNDSHFREARRWFSYNLKNTDTKGRFLYLKYFDKEVARSAEILVNETPAGTIELNGEGGNNYQEKVIAIPESETGKQELILKVSGLNNHFTMQLIEVRLLTKNEIP
ncbi:glycoside hydrolase family 127 protein [Draconibacterium sp. IB214405]|uniref:glycoside hydrolase family 127 protein n=1 Tax=Draconibacterium sp. IB214405 TaxID=3097352 RepID=UPI002A10DD90|nr:glycoside hydrolase family 127 protein [Draconibacterium sp. IB214405]MDX8337757.1 glycoside hydrolase family 127 protein [Draconibacterium sp. IB214405]